MPIVKLGSSLQRERQRRRRRLLAFVMKWSFFLGLIILAGWYAWATASKVAWREANDLKTANQTLQTKVSALEAAAREATVRESALQAQLPSPEEGSLLETVRRKAAEGVSLARLNEIVSAASSTRRCDNTPATKRFRVRTPLGGGEEGAAASFADNAITVRAEGRSALNQSGAPEAWFDPAQPVTVSFLHLNGATSRAQGILPLQHAIAIGDDEFRFQIQAGSHGLIIITMDRCDYP